MSKSNVVADELAELDALVGGDAPDVVVIPATLPSVEGYPAVVEARRKAEEIAAQLRAAEAEEAELSKLLTNEQRRNPDASRILAQAEKMVGADGAADRIDRLERYVRARDSLPALEAASAMAATRLAEATAGARRRLAGVGRAVADAAVCAAVRSLLAAMVQACRVGDVHLRLRAAGIDDGCHYNPLGGIQIPMPGNPGFIDWLARLSHTHGLRFEAVTEAGAELVERGIIGPGHRAYFAK